MLGVFFAIAAAIVVSDQILKAWIVANYRENEPVSIVGDWIKIDFIHNRGGLFGIFQGSVPAFAAVSVVIIAFLVALELRSGWRSWGASLALSLLLGGAVGNFIDRVRLGYVIDFVDMGTGSLRWYIFNIADSAVTVSILLLLLLTFIAPASLNAVAGGGSSGSEPPRDGSGPVAE